MLNTTFLFELGVEELPPAYVIQYVKLFKKLFLKSCQENNFLIAEIDCELFATPRRLALKITLNEGNSSQKLKANPKKDEVIQNGILIQKQFGPKVKSLDEKSAQGFARGRNLSPSELLQDENGRVYCLVEVKAKSIKILLPDLIEQTFAVFNKIVALKPMRWGSTSFSFIRPVRWLLCLYGTEILPMQFCGLSASNVTEGHRFHSEGSIVIDSPEDYETILEKNYVLASFSKRKNLIEKQLSSVAAHIDASYVNQVELLEEVTSINEWPKVVLCHFDPSFLEVPKEVLIESMQNHQKSFALIADNKLKPYFMTVSNIESQNESDLIDGNEIVMSARLADARFFFETDQQYSLESFNEKNKTIVFQNKLGSVWDKTQRVTQLSDIIAKEISADQATVQQAALLANADLNSLMVYEFPELQGIMGKHYALLQGHSTLLTDCIEQRYWPYTAEADLPETKEALALALADRLDLLVGIFGIDLKPSGSKDPYSLRRAAIAVIRIIREKQLHFSLPLLLEKAIKIYPDNLLLADIQATVHHYILKRLEDLYAKIYNENQQIIGVLRAALASQNADLFDLDQRIVALKQFINSNEMLSVAESNKRLKNILAKNLNEDVLLTLNESLLIEDSEKILWQTYTDIQKQIVTSKSYADKFKALSYFDKPLADFFERVMVVAEDPNLKNNRLALLQQINALFMTLADLSQL